MSTIAQRPVIAALATDDEIAVSDTSATVTGRATLTVLRTLLNTYYAQLAAENTLTQNLIISKASPTLTLTPTSGTPGIINVEGSDNGASIGARIILKRNSNASTPAAGHIYMIDRGDQGYRVWPDDAGNLRIHTADPTSANDTAGTVVGAQTSSLDAKQLIGGLTSIDDVLAAVQRGADAVRRFKYKNGAFNNEEFEGIVVDYEPRYGTDKDEDHEAGKSLNLINAVGDLLRAVAWLVEREQARSQ